MGFTVYLLSQYGGRLEIELIRKDIHFQVFREIHCEPHHRCANSRLSERTVLMDVNENNPKASPARVPMNTTQVRLGSTRLIMSLWHNLKIANQAHADRYTVGRYPRPTHRSTSARQRMSCHWRRPRPLAYRACRSPSHELGCSP